MNSSADKNRIALLIDGENTDASYAVGIIRTIGRLGQIQIGNVYLDMLRPQTYRWSMRLAELPLEPVMVAVAEAKRNSSDISLLIDAVEIVHTRNIDTFCICSSDGDFTGLMRYLKSRGKQVIGVGNGDIASPALKASCDMFIELGCLGRDSPVRGSPAAAGGFCRGASSYGVSAPAVGAWHQAGSPAVSAEEQSGDSAVPSDVRQGAEAAAAVPSECPVPEETGTESESGADGAFPEAQAEGESGAQDGEFPDDGESSFMEEEDGSLPEAHCEPSESTGAGEEPLALSDPEADDEPSESVSSEGDVLPVSEPEADDEPSEKASAYENTEAESDARTDGELPQGMSADDGSQSSGDTEAGHPSPESTAEVQESVQDETPAGDGVDSVPEPDGTSDSLTIPEI